jgi:hypothetical protein
MTTIDKTPAGLQYVLPGAEKASDATMARRAAGKPLRASVPQMAPGPLFGEDALQSDLMDVLRQRRDGML